MRFRPMITILALATVTLLSGCASVLSEPESEAFERDYPARFHHKLMRDAQQASDDAAAEAKRAHDAAADEARRVHETATPPAQPHGPAR